MTGIDHPEYVLVATSAAGTLNDSTAIWVTC